jgi:hypothetical protein
MIIEPIILRKKIEDWRVVRALGCGDEIPNASESR